MLHLVLIVPHEPDDVVGGLNKFASLCHGSQTRAEEPADGEEGGGEVDEEEGEGGDEDVEVELGRNPAALVPAAVHVAEHANFVATNIDQLVHLKASNQLCLLLQIQVVPVHELTDPTEGEVASDKEGAEAFKDSSDEVGFEEGRVVLERLPHFHCMDRVLHTHFPGAFLHQYNSYLSACKYCCHFISCGLFVDIWHRLSAEKRCKMRLKTGRNCEKKVRVNLELRRVTVVIGIRGRDECSPSLPALSCP